MTCVLETRTLRGVDERNKKQGTGWCSSHLFFKIQEVLNPEDQKIRNGNAQVYLQLISPGMIRM